jgi:hypothetical protein
MNMTNRKVSHDVKLETSVKIILAVLAIGVMLNAVIPAVKSGTAFAGSHCGANYNPCHVQLSGAIGTN